MTADDYKWMIGRSYPGLHGETITVTKVRDGGMIWQDGYGHDYRIEVWTQDSNGRVNVFGTAHVESAADHIRKAEKAQATKEAE